MNIKNPTNLAGGCMAGLLAAWLLFTEGKILSQYMMSTEFPGLSLLLQIVFDIAAIGAFFFLLKQFLSLERQKLVLYYLLSVFLSAAAALLSLYAAFLLVSGWLETAAVSGFFERPVGKLVCYHLIFLALAFPTAIFVAAFSRLIKGKVLYIRYISQEIKKIEQEGFGRQIKVEGRDEISEICSSINHLSEKLLEKQQKEQQAEQRKNQLITNVSHDLRSPLTSIIGYVKLLKSQGADDPERFREYIDVVDRRLQSLNNMVNELFELTKLSEQDVSLNLEHLDLISLLNHLAWEYQLLLQQEGLKLEKHITAETFEMNLDSDKIVRAMQNLFDNARKYAKEGTAVVLSAEAEEHILTINMTNEIREGSIPEEENLFERFYKSDASRSNAESSGLGLAIVKRIIELHGGDIKAEMHGGSLSFCIRLIQ